MNKTRLFNSHAMGLIAMHLYLSVDNDTSTYSADITDLDGTVYPVLVSKFGNSYSIPLPAALVARGVRTYPALNPVWTDQINPTSIVMGTFGYADATTLTCQIRLISTDGVLLVDSMAFEHTLVLPILSLAEAGV